MPENKTESFNNKSLISNELFKNNHYQKVSRLYDEKNRLLIKLKNLNALGTDELIRAVNRSDPQQNALFRLANDARYMNRLTYQTRLLGAIRNQLEPFQVFAQPEKELGPAIVKLQTILDVYRDGKIEREMEQAPDWSTGDAPDTTVSIEDLISLRYERKYSQDKELKRNIFDPLNALIKDMTNLKQKVDARMEAKAPEANALSQKSEVAANQTTSKIQTEDPLQKDPIIANLHAYKEFKKYYDRTVTDLNEISPKVKQPQNSAEGTKYAMAQFFVNALKDSNTLDKKISSLEQKVRGVLNRNSPEFRQIIHKNKLKNLPLLNRLPWGSTVEKLAKNLLNSLKAIESGDSSKLVKTLEDLKRGLNRQPNNDFTRQLKGIINQEPAKITMEEKINQLEALVPQIQQNKNFFARKQQLNQVNAFLHVYTILQAHEKLSVQRNYESAMGAKAQDLQAQTQSEEKPKPTHDQIVAGIDQDLAKLDESKKQKDEEQRKKEKEFNEQSPEFDETIKVFDAITEDSPNKAPASAANAEEFSNAEYLDNLLAELAEPDNSISQQSLNDDAELERTLKELDDIMQIGQGPQQPSNTTAKLLNQMTNGDTAQLKNILKNTEQQPEQRNDGSKKTVGFKEEISSTRMYERDPEPEPEQTPTTTSFRKGN